MTDHGGNAIRTVLLDIDGTLLDTRTYILAAFACTAGRFAFSLPPADILTREIGRPLEAIYHELAPNAVVSDLIECHRTFQEENLDLVQAFPGCVEALSVLGDEGVALAAVTSRSRRTSVSSLDIAGIGHFFRIVVSAEDVPALKPDPAPLRAALLMLERTDAGAAMVGDTVHDVHAGQAMGIPTVAALYGFGGQSVLAAAPSLTIAAISDLPAALAKLGR